MDHFGAPTTAPDSGYFRAGTGQHVACLRGANNLDLSLHLQRWSGRSWQTVATARDAGAGGTEHLTYSGSAGHYRYQVVAVNGAGSFQLSANVP